MKILHTGSWRLGSRFFGHPREEEHLHFLEWLLGALREFQPDALFVTGDLFSSPRPSARAQALLGDFLLRAVSEVEGLQVVLLGGGGDGGARLEACEGLWKRHNVYVRSTVRRLPSGQPDFEEHLLPLSLRGGEEAVCVCLALPMLHGGDYPGGLPLEEGVRFWLENLRKALRGGPFKGLPMVVAGAFGSVLGEAGLGMGLEPSVSLGKDADFVDLFGKGICFSATSCPRAGMRVGCQERLSLAGSPLPLDFEEERAPFGANLVEIARESEEVEVRPLTYTPLRGLMSIPSQGLDASPSEVLELLGALSDRKEGESESEFPFLQVSVRSEQPEPDFSSELFRLCGLKAVSLCRVRSLSDKEKSGQERGNLHASSSLGPSSRPWLGAGGAHRNPLLLALEDFRMRFGGEMPQPLVERFKKASQEATFSTDTHED